MIYCNLPIVVLSLFARQVSKYSNSKDNYAETIYRSQQQTTITAKLSIKSVLWVNLSFEKFVVYSLTIYILVPSAEITAPFVFNDHINAHINLSQYLVIFLQPPTRTFLFCFLKKHIYLSSASPVSGIKYLGKYSSVQPPFRIFHMIAHFCLPVNGHGGLWSK